MKYLTCHNCLYADSPCVPEEYKLDNGAVAEICPNYKNVYDAYAELKKENNKLYRENGIKYKQAKRLLEQCDKFLTSDFNDENLEKDLKTNLVRDIHKLLNLSEE